MSDCPHSRTSPVDGSDVCDRCGEILERPALQLERLAEVRRLLHPEDDQ